ncbi:MAG: hypothetical protein K0V04_23350 [Deltaproteobacteria bacterium]|nr:hypothetical protein [Deltaproteobacteria bacterium]
MTRILSFLLVATAISLGCASDADAPDGGPGLLLADVDPGDLDPSRVRIGLFRADSDGLFLTADGPHSGSVRLRVLPGEGNRLGVWGFDDEGPLDEAEVEGFILRPIYEVSLDAFESFEDLTLELDAPLEYPREDYGYDGGTDSDGEEEGQVLMTTVIPLVWYDNDYNGVLDLDFVGESETVRPLTSEVQGVPIALSHLDFQWIFEGAPAGIGECDLPRTMGRMGGRGSGGPVCFGLVYALECPARVGDREPRALSSRRKALAPSDVLRVRAS